MMEIRQLELFLAVIDHASVTRAAESVNLSPGAVSLQLQNLAAELHTDLFVRAGKHLAPTPAALHLAQRARGLLRQMRDLEQEFENDPEHDVRPFHFATGATTLIHRLGKPLRLLRKRYPHTPVRVTASSTEEMVAGLLHRRFDLALISLPTVTTGLTVFELFDEELLILRPSTASVRGWHVGNLKPADLEGAPFLLYPQRSNMRSMIDQFFRDIDIAPQVVMEADDTEAIKSLVEAGFGSSVLPEFALRRQPRFFHTFRIPERRITRKQALAMVESEHPRAVVRSIALFLQSALTTERR